MFPTRVLVTGGSGFLGARLVEQLLAEGIAVRCLVRRASSLDRLVEVAESRGVELEVREGTLGKIGPGSEVARGCDVVYHAAAELRGSVSGMFLTNVVATRALVAASERAGVGRFVLVSSLGVYGVSRLRPGDMLDETCPLDPSPHLRDAYTYSKIAQEQAAWEVHDRGGIRLVVVRPSVIYGPGREVITARVGLKFRNFLVLMGGNHKLPYVFVDNCARGVLLAGTSPNVDGEAFNLVDDDLPTGRQIIKLHRREGGRIRVLPIPRAAIRPISRLNSWYHEYSRGQLPAVLTAYKSDAQWKPLNYSNAKAKLMLSWIPGVGLDEGLRRSVTSLRPADGAN